MRLLIIGCNGQLGRDMVVCAKEAGYNVDGLDIPLIDLTEPLKTLSVLDDFEADMIINCSGYTAVDAAESNSKIAFAINRDGVALLARFALQRNIPMVHFSTDYVFDGNSSTPYIETDKPNPLSVYGKSKLAGEEILASLLQHHYIFRTAWLYGHHGANFVKTILAIARQSRQRGEAIKVVNDQIGTPTFTRQVCRQVLKVIETKNYGIFHSTCEGCCSWFDFASYIVRSYKIEVEVIPCSTAEFPRPAPRPKFSVLENARLKKLGINIMTPWEKAFDEFILLENR